MKGWITARAGARMIGVAYNTFLKMMKGGEWQYKELHRKFKRPSYYVRPEELEAYTKGSVK